MGARALRASVFWESGEAGEFLTDIKEQKSDGGDYKNGLCSQYQVSISWPETARWFNDCCVLVYQATLPSVYIWQRLWVAKGVNIIAGQRSCCYYSSELSRAMYLLKNL
ncbi:MAG: hypothetical protein PHQ58_03630 [Rhodoferax sp.]|uniref:hypothetical protein n=1 Tax=Rhodoferax sp. TaxID=50421 RepID=UPI00262CEABA|nr:hypothetical protein [Rhodoferax sp.]MDD2879504.1 hypothetical protein [Rhodoferax sp.]